MTRTMVPAMIRLEHVSKSFRRDGVTKHILHDVSFDLPPDRNIAILGRNGAGKSTLMRLIAGTLRPDRGQILRRRRISWVAHMASMMTTTARPATMSTFTTPEKIGGNTISGSGLGSFVW